MATAEARSKKSLKKQDEIIERLTRIEDMLSEVLTGAGAPTPAAQTIPRPAFESASGLDTSAANRSIAGGNPPNLSGSPPSSAPSSAAPQSPRPKAR